MYNSGCLSVPFFPLPETAIHDLSIGSSRMGSSSWELVSLVTKYTPDVTKVIDAVRTIKEFNKEFIKLNRKLLYGIRSNV